MNTEESKISMALTTLAELIGSVDKALEDLECRLAFVSSKQDDETAREGVPVAPSYGCECLGTIYLLQNRIICTRSKVDKITSRLEV